MTSCAISCWKDIGLKNNSCSSSSWLKKDNQSSAWRIKGEKQLCYTIVATNNRKGLKWPGEWGSECEPVWHHISWSAVATLKRQVGVWPLGKLKEKWKAARRSIRSKTGAGIVTCQKTVHSVKRGLITAWLAQRNFSWNKWKALQLKMNGLQLWRQMEHLLIKSETGALESMVVKTTISTGRADKHTI